MKIIEAINSGKYFRRKNSSFLCGKEKNQFFWIDENGVKRNCFFGPEDISADDWEIIDDKSDVRIKENIDYLISVGLTPDQYSDEYYGIKK